MRFSPVSPKYLANSYTALCLSLEIIGLAKQFGLERLGFLTLTFVENVYDIREANRRFNSLNTHVIKDRYERAIAVVERQERGAVHFHLLVVAASDIRTGSDFEAFKRRDYRSANPALRAEWAFWRATCSKYGFGRHELLPVRSTAEGIARYVASYIGKNIRARNEGDKGARLVRYIGYGVGDRKASPQFAWAYGNGWLWRHKLAAWATRHGARDASELSRIFGPRWAYALQAWILAEELPGGLVCPSFLVANRSIDTCVPVWLARSKADKVKEGMTFNRCYDLDKDKLWTAKQANR